MHLTKSRYLAGLQCLRRLWLGVNQPPEWVEPAPGSSQDIGAEIGLKAHLLFPGGILVEEAPWQHEEAVARTRVLMADRSVPAIFEAAVEQDGIRVRVDVLERLPRGRWGLREVKSSGSVKDHYLDDVAVQMHVLAAAGLRLSSVELLFVNKDYVRGEHGIAWAAFFSREDVKDRAAARLDGIADRIAGQMACLRQRKEPMIEPGAHCSSPYACDYWDHCTAGKPKDWVALLPRLTEKALGKLTEAGFEAISAIPADFPLTNQHAVIRDVLVSGRPFVAPDLARLLQGFVAPALYLDFEAFAPTIPLYAGTRPFQTIPFQWSLHRLDADGTLSHLEFLADGAADPRRDFAESLIRAVGPEPTPIIVYSSYEQTQLKTLAERFDDLKAPIEAIIARLRDLLPVVRGAIYHPGFNFSYSIKTVGPALCPDFSYDDLDQVADGLAAANAFYRLASGGLDTATATGLRQALLTYCERDTLAMVEVHRALVRMAKEPGTA